MATRCFCPPGHLIWHVVCPLFQPQAVQIFQCQRITFAAAHSLIKERKRHILHCILEGNEIEGLEDETNHTVAVLGCLRFAEVLDEGTVQIILPPCRNYPEYPVY